MEKKLSDYLHLYLGCQFVLKLKNQDGYSSEMYFGSDALFAASQNGKDDFIEPILLLRPLSSMTEEEMKELWELIMKRPFHQNGRIEKSYLQDKKNPRWILMSGVERLGIQHNGNIWADSDLHLFYYNDHEVTRWLLSKGFDLFGLIEAGLALDATQLTKNN